MVTLGLGVYCFGFKDQYRVRVAMMTMMMRTTLNDDDDDDDDDHDAGRLTLSSVTGSNGCVQALGGESQEVPRTA